MKKISNLILGLFYVISFAQDNTSEKLKFHSFSISPIEIYGNKNTGGASISSDYSLRFNKNIYSLSTTFSEELTIWSRGNRYFQLNTLFGREHEIAKWFCIDTHVGIGLINMKNNHSSKATLGFPIQVKLRIKTGPKFSLGLRFQSNLNSERHIATAGIILQWNSLNIEY